MLTTGVIIGAVGLLYVHKKSQREELESDIKIKRIQEKRKKN